MFYSLQQLEPAADELLHALHLESGHHLFVGHSDLLHPFQEADYRRLLDLLTYQARWHQLDPLTLGDFLRSDGIWHRDVPNLAGHRDMVVTECPGDEVYRLLPEVRGCVDVVMTTADDWGTQNTLIAPPETYRQLFLPYYRRLNDEIHRLLRPKRRPIPAVDRHVAARRGRRSAPGSPA